MARLTLALLGDFQARVGPAPPLDIRARRTQALLAYLAVPPGQPHSRDKLAALLWGDVSQHDARSRLRRTLFALRRALIAVDPTCLRLNGNSVALSESVDVDAVAFEQLVRDGTPPALEQAVALYRGDFLQGMTRQADEFEDWLMAQRDRLREQVLEAMAKLLAQQRDNGHIDAALQTALRMVAIDPLQEAVHRTLMRLYAQRGRRAAALGQYQRCVALLKRELGADPEAETNELYRDIVRRRTLQAPRPHVALSLGAPPGGTLERSPHNLPRQLTSFIGRRKEMGDVKRLLSATTCLLTLTGPGGCGKTRLALQVAGDMLDGYADGVRLVELASLADPLLVPQAVALALCVREQPGQPLTQTLADYLKPARLLLILDSCEHLLMACAQLADTLLRRCSHLKILASSREGLGIAGELTYPVPSLATPDPRQLPPLDRLTTYEAVQLFSERAEFSQPRFAVTAQNAAAVAHICYRLDGIPLAIELAATQVRALSVQQIATRLAEDFSLLTGGSRTALPRYQTLQATMDWSHSLLTAPDRALLRRLSVFAGGFTSEAAEAICADEEGQSGDLRAILTRLVEKSLVIHTGREGPARYRLLETVRQYASEKLAEAGETETMRERHRDFFLAMAEEAEPELWSANAASWLDRLEADHDNLRAGLEWSLTRSPALDTALRLAGALRRFWSMRGHWTEGRAWMKAVVSHPDSAAWSGPTKAARAKVLQGAGLLAWRQGDLVPARDSLEASVVLFRDSGDPRQACLSLLQLGMVAGFQGDLTRARALSDESVVLLRELGDRWALAMALNAQGLAAATQGDDASACSALEECLAIFREVGDNWFLPIPLANLGQVAYRRGDYAAARGLSEESLMLSRKVGNESATSEALAVLGLLAFDQGDYPTACAFFGESLVIAHRAGDKRGTHWMLEALARLATAQQQPERAARLLASARSFREAAGPFGLPFVIANRWSDGVADGARRAMGEEAFASAWAQGRAMALERAVEYALHLI